MVHMLWKLGTFVVCSGMKWWMQEVDEGGKTAIVFVVVLLVVVNERSVSSLTHL